MPYFYGKGIIEKELDSSGLGGRHKMAKLHYTIDSKKKARIEKEHGKTRIIIEDVVMIEENRVIKLDYGEFINVSENKERKYKFDEWITIILYLSATILLVVMFSMFGIGKDFGILTSGYIDNIIGIAALLFGLASIPKVKECLGKNLTGPRICNKLWYVVMILCIPFYIIAILNGVGLSSSISNICGIIGIIICIMTW